MSENLDELKRSIIAGDPNAWKTHQLVADIAAKKDDAALCKKAAEVLVKIENGGALGLKYALDQVASVRSRCRQRALQQLVFGDAK